MKKQFSILLLLCGLMACGGDDRSPFIEEIEEDLLLLTADTGGTQRAVLRQESGSDFDYYVYEPSGYQTDGTTYPLIIYLHGLAPFGNEGDLDKILQDGPPRLIEEGRWDPKYPALVVSPHLLNEDLDWQPNRVQAFIEHIESEYRVNPRRIYITGISIGGIGVFEYLINLASQSKVAAALPIAGAGAERIAASIDDIPIWAFHGEQDRVISFRRGSQRMIEAINENDRQNRALLTTFEGAGHDVWTRTYDGTGMGQENLQQDRFTTSVIDWMLGKTKD